MARAMASVKLIADVSKIDSMLPRPPGEPGSNALSAAVRRPASQIDRPSTVGDRVVNVPPDISGCRAYSSSYNHPRQDVAGLDCGA